MKQTALLFEAEVVGRCERVTAYLSTSGSLPFSRSSRTEVPFDDWAISAPEQSRAAVARLLQAWADNETANDGAPLVEPAGASVKLHGDFVATLSDPEAVSLGLPPAARLSLNVQSVGIAHQPDFRVEKRWTRPNGLPASVRTNGCRLVSEGREWRIANPIWSVLDCIERLNAAEDQPARQAALASLRAAIGEEAGNFVKADGFIDRLRLSYAAGFSLSLQPSAHGFDFDPVLFSPKRLHDADDGTTLDEEADGLLPPVQQKAFTRRFRSGDGTRSAYLLDDGAILYLDPGLQRALKIVREAQAGDAETRRDFARNPQRKIREALGEDSDAALASAALFVETQQFSERVSGIDLWRKPVLPWIKPKPNSWLPENFGLWLGDPPAGDKIEITPEQVPALSQGLEQAFREERPSFDFNGHTIPATEQTRAAVASLVEVTGCMQDSTSSGQAIGEAGSAPEALAGRYFLQVRDNLEDVAYSPLGRSTPIAAPSAAFPASVRSSPKAHQTISFDWLVSCWRAGLPGALLADDMGLGKTFQALSFLAWLRSDAAERRPILIVAPTGLLANWRAEIVRHLEPDALGRVVEAYGAKLRGLRSEQGRDIERGRSTLDPDQWLDAGLVLTTFETMRDYHLSFARQPFAVIIYDEVQKLKSPASQMTRAAKTLNARFQLAMTGTPVENKLQDLWSIYDVIHPGLLGSSKSFETSYPAGDSTKLRELHTRLTKPDGRSPPGLLRRMKDECLDGLPAKYVRPVPTPMPPGQAEAYRKVLQRAYAARGTGQRGHMLEILHMLRGVSLHPTPPEQAGEGFEAESARLQATFTLLDEIRDKGEKALLFCESLAMQALLAVEIRRRYRLPHDVARIHGGVAGDVRQRLVDAFQRRDDGFDVMILSPKAGGVGITLTAANHVIHLSRWWNPAVEDQATDRAYRIGQTKDVHVYLPQAIHPDPSIGPTSFDLKLDALMTRKRTLSRDLFLPGESESDVEELLDAVLAEAEPSGAAAPSQPEAKPEPSAAASGESADQAAQRPVLTARAPVVGPAPPAPGPQPPAPRRVAFAEGQKREHAIFLDPLRGAKISVLTIRDPYGCADPRNRQALIDFVSILARSGVTIDSVRVIALDPDSVNRFDPETDREQREDLERKWRAKIRQPALPSFTQVSKRVDRGFHDRRITAELASGETLGWDVSNGLDGVMLPRKECTIHFWTE